MIFIYYLFIFIIYSIIGWIFETSIAYITNIDFNSGIMFGPWTPVYGFSVILMIIIWRKWLYKFQHNKIKKSIIFFFITIIILSLLELLGGVLIEVLTGKVYWDYSKTFYLHIGKYISVEVSLIWGILSLITIWLVNPKIEKIIKKIPKIIFYIFYIAFIIDLLMTIITKFV